MCTNKVFAKSRSVLIVEGSVRPVLGGFTSVCRSHKITSALGGLAYEVTSPLRASKAR